MLQGFLVYIVAVLCFTVHYFLGNSLTDRPLIVGTLVGLVLGDIRTGVILGAQFELVFLGITNAGGVVPANTDMGTAVAVALAILSGMDADAALAVAVPVALLGAHLITIMYTLRSLMNPYVEKIISAGEYKKVGPFVFAQAIISYLIVFLPVWIVVAFGVDIINQIISAIPAFIMSGLSVASGMLAAVGFGMLLKLVWRKSLAVYFFIGYLLAAYLNLPVLGVALAGILYVIALYFMQKNRPAVQVTEAAITEEELFND